MMITHNSINQTGTMVLSEIQKVLTDINSAFFISVDEQTHEIDLVNDFEGMHAEEKIVKIPVYEMEQFGDADFRETYGVRCAFYAGAMANGISSTEMVIALGKAGFLGSFGAAGLPPVQLEAAVDQIQTALPNGPYAFNLIHSPYEAALEERAVQIYINKKVNVVEASAYLKLTPSIVYYRAAGLQEAQDGTVIMTNRVIAKLSRTEVAEKFLQPAPDEILDKLVEENKITRKQADLARRVPMADDITVEADSGGHTDNRPLLCLMPTMLALRDKMQAQYGYETPVRVGAGGGISTPAAVLGAFMMGAAYVVTGSINQACVEAGASPHTKKLLSEAGMADITMAPSADMFEMGVKVQVLKRGTFFPMRAQKLYEIYTHYDSIDDIPVSEREKLETQIFRRDLESIWQDTVAFFEERDPAQIKRAEKKPKNKMALIFRWYLGLSSRWSNGGESDREMDYQIWCGPAMGSFNDWTRSTYLSEIHNRRIVDVTTQLFTGAVYLYRVQLLKMHGIQVPAKLASYYPLSSMVK